MAITETYDPALNSIVDEVLQCHSEGRRFLPIGNGTKPLLSASEQANVYRYSMSAWSGIVDYQPFEFTITAKSGTRIREIATALEAQGQFLPFDPLWIDSGATLGGTIATGISGPGRLLFGGIRDFILGVQLIDGLGKLVRGGGKVVKNAAGFDIPKLMVGSLGRFGVITEVTLKVFPQPIGYRTLKVTCPSIAYALQHISSLMLLPVDIVAVELEPDGSLWIRVAGDELTTSKLVTRIQNHLGVSRAEVLYGKQEQEWWQLASELNWCSDQACLIRVPLTKKDVPALERSSDRLGAGRRYSSAANAAWISLAEVGQLEPLDKLLAEAGLKGLVLRGGGSPLIGRDDTALFARRIQQAMDPENRFVSF